MLDSKILLEFANTFYGYGDLSAPLWFIGMEEAGGDKETVQRRLDTWAARGRRQVEDLADYHEAIGVSNLTSKKSVRLQSTWAKLIYFQLAAEGSVSEREMVRKFQSSTWGREASRTCLLELMPLPKRSAASWEYDEWTDVPELWSRELYFAHFAAMRAQGLKNLFQEYKPKVVVFYGKGHVFSCHWPWIVGVKPKHWQNAGSWSETEVDGSKYMIAPHPTAHSSDNATWRGKGASVAERVSVERPDLVRV